MAYRSQSAFTLDEQLCFALHSASRAMTGAYRDGLDRLGLTYTQYVVLLVLWEHHSLPMNQLGERLHLDSATLSPLLKRLARQQLVTRRRSPHDERIVEITCTAAGHELRDRARAVQVEVERHTGLSGRELAAMRADLHRLAARLRSRPLVGHAQEA
ncbi:MarR family winged helix-turn-helix transcriptional regulator [Pseudonocardia sp.]|uniref:MarR family winged helix-turn-helix transcriptional regulator n=1 Tax=Pseudonocardia sp. TaxID=60912 RepID=UPI003D120B93